MNKNELIDAIASGSGLSKADAGRALEAFLGSVSSTLAGGGSVKITGFGTRERLGDFASLVLRIHRGASFVASHACM